MLKWLKSLFVADDQETWIEWQRTRPLTHFHNSEVYMQFLNANPDFVPLDNSVVNGHLCDVYSYTFGDFAKFIVNGGKTDVNEYIRLLLNLYDACKGYLRSNIKGDPEIIGLMRNSLKTNNASALFFYRYENIKYDYSVLHGHTVAEFSLSTLIGLFLCNFLHHKSINRCDSINIELLRVTLEKKIYGEVIPNRSPSSSSVPIIPITNNKLTLSDSSDFRSKSMPTKIDSINLSTCSSCKRLTESLYGDFRSCIDCHTKCVCSICGYNAMLKGPDNLPRCLRHHKRI